MCCTPIYPPVLTHPRRQGRRSIGVPLRRDPSGRWKFDLARMQAEVDQASRSGNPVKIFFLCNPHNPVGRVFTRSELLSILDFCQTNDLILISDEIHSSLILSKKAKHISMLAIPGATERTVVFNAPSKTYNIAGLKHAFAVIPDDKLRAVFKAQCGGLVGDVSFLGNIATEVAYSGACEPWKADALAYLQENLEYLQERLKHPNFKRFVLDAEVEGTYLAWIDARGMACGERKDPYRQLLEECHVGLNDGRLFGIHPSEYEGWVRLNFACSRATLKEALDRIEKHLGFIINDADASQE